MSSLLPVPLYYVGLSVLTYVALRQVVAPTLVHLYECWYPPPPPRWKTCDEVHAEFGRLCVEREGRIRDEMQREFRDILGP